MINTVITDEVLKSSEDLDNLLVKYFKKDDNINVRFNIYRTDYEDVIMAASVEGLHTTQAVGDRYHIREVFWGIERGLECAGMRDQVIISLDGTGSLCQSL
jgi:hypothetical protein